MNNFTLIGVISCSLILGLSIGFILGRIHYKKLVDEIISNTICMVNDNQYFSEAEKCMCLAALLKFQSNLELNK